MMSQGNEDENKQTLLENGQYSGKGLDLRIKPKRNVIVEPLMFLFFLSGMPVMDLKSQYIYTRIAADMGIDLNNLTGCISSRYNFSDFYFVEHSEIQPCTL